MAAGEVMVTALDKGQTRKLLAGFTLAHVAHHVSNSMLNPLLPLIRDSFALSYAQSGLLVSAFAVSAGVSNAPMGVLADRIGSRPVLVAGLILTGVVSLALALSDAYWQLLVLLVMMGLVAGTYHAPAATLIARAFPPRVRGAAIGLHVTGGHFSFFLMPLIAAALVSMTGSWRTPYLWLAFAPVVCGVLLWYLAPGTHERPPGGLGRLAVFRDLWTVVRVIGPFVSLSMLFQMVYQALNAFTALYLVDARGFHPAVAAVLFAMPQLGGTFGATLGGYISDRLGRRAVIVIGICALGPSIYALTLVPDELILLPLLAYGLAGSMRGTVTEVLVTDSAPAHRRATVLGAYHMLFQELGGLGAPLFGLLAGIIGIAAAYSNVSLALAVGSVLVLLAYRRL